MSKTVPRGTSNTNDRGSSASRRARRTYLVSPESGWGGDGKVVPCYRAATHCGNYTLTAETMQVDRIRPGILHGRYVRGNIRPSCAGCNFTTGIELREKIRRGEILIMNNGNIVLYKEGRTWTASAQINTPESALVIVDAKSTRQLDAMAELASKLFDKLLEKAS